MNIQLPLLLFEWISVPLSFKKHRGGVRGGVETETTMSAGEGPSRGRPRAPGIEENRNAKRCRNWIRAHAGEMAAKREKMMSAREGPSGGVVNPMPERSVSARGQRSGRGACLTFASTSVSQLRRGVEGAEKKV
jgi:hypothetical protein